MTTVTIRLEAVSTVNNDSANDKDGRRTMNDCMRHKRMKAKKKVFNTFESTPVTTEFVPWIYRSRQRQQTQKTNRNSGLPQNSISKFD